MLWKDPRKREWLVVFIPTTPSYKFSWTYEFMNPSQRIISLADHRASDPEYAENTIIPATFKEESNTQDPEKDNSHQSVDIRIFNPSKIKVKKNISIHSPKKAKFSEKVRNIYDSSKSKVSEQHAHVFERIVGTLANRRSAYAERIKNIDHMLYYGHTSSLTTEERKLMYRLMDATYSQVKNSVKRKGIGRVKDIAQVTRSIISIRRDFESEGVGKLEYLAGVDMTPPDSQGTVYIAKKDSSPLTEKECLFKTLDQSVPLSLITQCLQRPLNPETKEKASPLEEVLSRYQRQQCLNPQIGYSPQTPIITSYKSRFKKGIAVALTALGLAGAYLAGSLSYSIDQPTLHPVPSLASSISYKRNDLF